MYIFELKKSLNGILKKISTSNQSNKVASNVSPIWLEAFSSRLNFPSLDDLIAFRRNGATYGVGDPIYCDTNLLDEHCRKNSLLLRGDGIDNDFLGRLSESAIGAPRVSGNHLYNFEASPNYLKNLRNAYRIYKCLSPIFGDKQISICEIGAGYGMLATMLYRLFKVKNYVVIDLPQNLYLSAYYLGTNFPDKSIGFIQEDLRLPKDLNDLNFSLADNVDKIGCKFDLIINIDSFGEMPAETACYYVNWAKDHLIEGGILHTDNRIRVPDNKGPQDFGGLGYLSSFQFFHVDGARTQAEIFNQPHHILFLQKELGAISEDVFWNSIAFLYGAGLADSINPYVQNEHGPLEQKLLERINNLFTIRKKIEIIALSEQLKNHANDYPFLHYLVLLVAFSSGCKPKEYINHLIGYLKINSHEPANVIAMILYILLFKNRQLSGLVSNGDSNLENSFKDKYPHLSDDLNRLLENPTASLRLVRGYAVEVILGKSLKKTFFSRIIRRISDDYLRDF